MGSITTLSHCAVKDGKAYEGTKEEIIHQIGVLRLDEFGTFYFKAKGYNETKLTSYCMKEWSKIDAHKDMIKILYSRLPKYYGFKLYREIL